MKEKSPFLTKFAQIGFTTIVSGQGKDQNM
jgi:hypothetical protein